VKGSNYSQAQVDFIMRNYAKSPERAAEILYDPDPSVRLKAALSTETPHKLLVELSFDVDLHVRLAVMKNPNTPQETKDRIRSRTK
jgi:hypothetical protein